MHITWIIVNSGTRNVGIRLSGSSVTNAIVGPLGLMILAVTPSVTAVTRSKIPSSCHAMNLPRCSGFASFHATSAAVAPIVMSPYPAGRANTDGSARCASSTTNTSPRILQVCQAVKVCGLRDSANLRNPSEAPNHTKNTSSGTSAAIPTVTPTPCRGFSNAPCSAATRAKTNHAITRPTIHFP